MSKAKILLIAAMLVSGAPLQACNLDGGFGMHRFNPFQAAHSGAGSSSWNDTLLESSNMSRQPEAPLVDDDIVEKSRPDTQTAVDQDPASRSVTTGQGNREGGKQSRVISTKTDSQTERAVVD